jgi:beta-glucanase (GH16 family)
MRADSTKIVGTNDRGRDSVRISSWNAYDEAVIVLDVQHMPEGCATWPAFWTLSQAGPWPNGGEIDIIEGTS